MNAVDFKYMQIDISVEKTKHKEGVIMPIQSHSNVVRVVRDGLEDLRDCDGVVTDNAQLSIGVRTADCAPIVFSDGEQVCVIHAGWRGLCAGIIENALSHYEGGEPEVYVGPHLHAFEIQEDFCFDAVTQKFGAEFLKPEGDAFTFHFREAIASCLPEGSVFDPRDTKDTLTLPSYRHKRMFGHIVTSVALRI